MYSFLRNIGKGLSAVFHIKGVNLQKIGAVVQLIFGAFQHSEQSSNEAVEAGAEKPAGSDKLAVADSVLVKALPFIEQLIGKRFNTAKVQAAKNDLLAAIAAFHKAVLDAEEIVEDVPSNPVLSSPATGSSIADTPGGGSGGDPVDASGTDTGGIPLL